ncbi:MAG: hypothetical protein ACRYE8_07260 [Janthinobacterium lividum]
MKTELPERSLHIRGRLNFIKSMSCRGLTTVSKKTTKNINIIDIFNWI